MLTAVSGRSIVGLVKPVPDILMTVAAYRVGYFSLADLFGG